MNLYFPKNELPLLFIIKDPARPEPDSTTLKERPVMGPQSKSLPRCPNSSDCGKLLPYSASFVMPFQKIKLTDAEMMMQNGDTS